MVGHTASLVAGSAPHAPWAFTVAVGLVVTSQVIVACVALRKSNPAERPPILEQLAKLWWPWRRR